MTYVSMRPCWKNSPIHMSNYLAIHIRPDADIQSLVNAGDWDAIAAHCRADVELTVGLAKRLGHLREEA